MERISIAVAVLILATACASSSPESIRVARGRALAEQNAAIARYQQQQEVANPLNLLAAVELDRKIQDDPGATAAQRAEADQHVYHLAYKFARAIGTARPEARKFAGEIVERTR